MTSERDRQVAEALLERGNTLNVEKLVAALRDARVEAYEDAASIAFEKVRCDDRTDRWQVANEVAAHIRAAAVKAGDE